MNTLYLDSSAIVKRYVLEENSDVITEAYNELYAGKHRFPFSTWNVGEVLEVLDRYLRRGWTSKEDYLKAEGQFIGETARLLKLKMLKIVPVRTRIIIET